MSYQYIHTSAKRGLEPGQSGFCCVARDADTPPDLIRELERLSQYDHQPNGDHPIIRRFQIVDTRQSRYYLLSLIQDAGVDYSKRNNHIAHHLAFTEDEIKDLPDPASILLCWTKWHPSWTEPPHLLKEQDRFDIQDLYTNRMEHLTPPDFPTLLNAEGPHQLVFNIDSGDEEIATFHIRNALQHLPKNQRWEFPFTSHLQSNDNPSLFIWAAAQRDRVLPYDLDLNPRPLPSNEPKTDPELEVDDEPAVEQDTSFIKVAPKVEIPKEFDRRKLKKPKAKWNERKISLLINTSIIGIAAISITLFIIFALPDSSNEIDDSSSETNAAPRLSAQEQAQERWSQLAQEGRLLEQYEDASALVRTLDKFGNPEPYFALELLHALHEAYALAPVQGASLSQIRPSVMEVGSINASFDLETYELPDFQKFSDRVLLSPQYLLEPMATLKELGADISMIFDSLGPHQFDASTISLAIRECRRVNRDLFSNQLPTKDQAIIDFFELKRSLLSDRRLEPLLKIQIPFNLNAGDAYIAFDSDGMLQDTTELSYTDYLQHLFEGFILPKFTRFEATSEYREALKTSSDRNFESPIEVAKAINTTMQIANPLEPGLKDDWEKITRIWKKTFFREDLMEETLIAFAVENLETHRKQLSDYQAHFTKQELGNYRTYKQIAQILNDLEKEISESSLKFQTWHFIRK